MPDQLSEAERQELDELYRRHEERQRRFLYVLTAEGFIKPVERIRILSAALVGPYRCYATYQFTVTNGPSFTAEVSCYDIKHSAVTLRNQWALDLLPAVQAANREKYGEEL